MHNFFRLFFSFLSYLCILRACSSAYMCLFLTSWVIRCDRVLVPATYNCSFDWPWTEMNTMMMEGTRKKYYAIPYAKCKRREKKKNIFFFFILFSYIMNRKGWNGEERKERKKLRQWNGAGKMVHIRNWFALFSQCQHIVAKSCLCMQGYF